MCELDDSTPEIQRGARELVKCKRKCFMIVNIVKKKATSMCVVDIKIHLQI